MLYEPTNTPAMARTSNLNEELGQVNSSNIYYANAYLKDLSLLQNKMYTHEVSVIHVFVYVGEIHFL